MDLKQQLINMFGKDWYEVLSEYLHSQSFLDIAKTIQKERNYTPVYPSSENVFKAFRSTGYYQTKVVLLADEPYTIKEDSGVANGLAFCCNDSLYDTKTMEIILREIDLEYPENKDNIVRGLVLGDLSRWANQGVLLLNKSLTVAKNKPRSHIQYWNSFTNKIITTLDNKPQGVVFLLIGKEAQSVKPLIPKNPIVEGTHPSVHIHGGEGFLHSGIFRQVNEQLKAINKSEIIW